MTSASTRAASTCTAAKPRWRNEYKNYDDSWEPTDSSTSFSISGQFTLDGDKLDITLDDD